MISTNEAIPIAILALKAASIITIAIALWRGAMAPFVRHSAIIGPNARLFSSQFCKRCELLPNANAARIMNGVVGKSGSTTPTAPSASATHPRPNQAPRLAIGPALHRISTDLNISALNRNLSSVWAKLYALLILMKRLKKWCAAAWYVHPDQGRYQMLSEGEIRDGLLFSETPRGANFRAEINGPAAAARPTLQEPARRKPRSVLRKSPCRAHLQFGHSHSHRPIRPMGQMRVAASRFLIAR